jgi:poly-gamma-glutamate synthesis protein (capsule biosynthesis protein)
MLIGGSAAALGWKASSWRSQTILTRSDTVADLRTGYTDGVRLFLAGDVMLGRGVDQVLPHPSDPRIYEPALSSATGYVDLAERAHGPIPKPVNFQYVWGDALDELRRAQPDAQIVNLETSITKSDRYAPKGINYRMSPGNVPCLVAAGIDCCALANNHVLDWGAAGLIETVDTLESAGIWSAGAGRDARQASAPVFLDAPSGGRIVVFAFGSETSGIPSDWAAGEHEPGVNLLRDLSDRTAARIAEQTAKVRRSGDLVIASIHWGPNWGHEISRPQRRFAHGLIDAAGFDVVYGHSAHHPKGIEVYRRKLILYGCGDFLNDYEGIGGYEEYRGDLVLMYLPLLSRSAGDVLQLRMIPFQIRKFRLNRASVEDAAWLRDTLDRESARLGTRITLTADNTLSLVLT